MTDVLPPAPPQPAQAPVAPAPPLEPAAAPAVTLSLGVEELNELLDLKEAMLDRAKGHLAQAQIEMQLAQADIAAVQALRQQVTADKPVQLSTAANS